MSAYLYTQIEGNKNFGGYLSVDGEKARPIADDKYFELAPGHHVLRISTSSDGQKRLGKVQAFAYTHSSSSGAIADVAELASTVKNLGEDWEINVVVEDHQMVALSVMTKREKIVGDPIYKVVDLEEEEAKELEKMFDEWRNTPVRSKKLMIIGIVLALVGIEVVTTSGMNIGAIILAIAMLAGGVLLFLSGFKKKIRRK